MSAEKGREEQALDPEYRPLACAKGLAVVDTKQGILYLKNGEQVDTAPVYSTAELLEEAEKELSSQRDLW